MNQRTMSYEPTTTAYPSQYIDGIVSMKPFLESIKETIDRRYSYGGEGSLARIEQALREIDRILFEMKQMEEQRYG